MSYPICDLIDCVDWVFVSIISIRMQSLISYKCNLWRELTNELKNELTNQSDTKKMPSSPMLFLLRLCVRHCIIMVPICQL